MSFGVDVRLKAYTFCTIIIFFSILLILNYYFLFFLCKYLYVEIKKICVFEKQNLQKIKRIKKTNKKLSITTTTTRSFNFNNNNKESDI